MRSTECSNCETKPGGKLSESSCSALTEHGYKEVFYWIWRRDAHFIACFGRGEKKKPSDLIFLAPSHLFSRGRCFLRWHLLISEKLSLLSRVVTLVLASSSDFCSLSFRGERLL